MSALLIRWYGHSCFGIVSGKKIAIDPHNGRSIGLKPPRLRADIALITHDHFDHNAIHVLGGNPEILRESGHYEYDGIKITGITAYHDRAHGAKRGKITMFKIQAEGLSILHMGDIGHVPEFEQLEKIGHVDILMLPVGGTYTIGPEEAKETVKKIAPKIVIPMHYKLPGLSLAIGPVEDFLQYYPEESIMHVGNEVEISRAELPENTEIWVFSY